MGLAGCSTEAHDPKLDLGFSQQLQGLHNGRITCGPMALIHHHQRHLLGCKLASFQVIHQNLWDCRRVKKFNSERACAFESSLQLQHIESRLLHRCTSLILCVVIRQILLAMPASTTSGVAPNAVMYVCVL